MTRRLRTTLAHVLLLTLPLAGVVVTSHVHGPINGPAAGDGVCPCDTVAAPVAGGNGCAPAAGGEDQPLCPICELARSLHAAGLSAPAPLPTPGSVSLACTPPVDHLPAPAAIRAASRSPPLAAAAA